MKSKWIVGLASIGLSFFFAIGNAAFGEDGLDAPAPNVLIVIVDDQGYGDLSAHGNPRLFHGFSCLTYLFADSGFFAYRSLRESDWCLAYDQRAFDFAAR